VGESQNAFAVESFVDELAASAGADPLEFRRTLLSRRSRHRVVLDLAAQKAGWGGPLPPRHGRGIAVYHSYGSWVAQVAEVSVTPDDLLRVHRVVCAIDCGIAVNPNTVAAQVEGAVAFGLSAALFEAITLERGEVQQKSFDDYRLLALREMPAVEVHILPSREAPGGVGEPGVPPLAAAIANAIGAVTGRRLRRLPLLGQGSGAGLAGLSPAA
jgi:isoquinoline 1-oxidoreductase beta subunit